MPITRSQFQRLMFPGLREFIFLAYREKEAQYSTVLNVKDSDSAFEEDMTGAGLGLFVRTPEQVETPEDEFVAGYPIRYDHVDYSLRVGFSHQFLRDAKYNIAAERSSDLGFSARQTMEVLIADVFNNGFTANGFDGVPLFSASHPLEKGGGSGGQTQSNVLASPSTLSVVSLRTMLPQFRRFFDRTGVRRIEVTPETLLVPPELEYDANEIIKSAGRPDTANRADNVVRNALKPVVWDYLLNTKYWFVGAAKNRHKVKCYIRERFNVSDFYDDKSRTNWVQGGEAFSYGHSDWVGWMGTNPA